MTAEVTKIIEDAAKRAEQETADAPAPKFAGEISWPVEAKLGATPKKEWVKNFHLLERLPEACGPGAVVCLREERVAIARGADAVPVGLI